MGDLAADLAESDGACEKGEQQMDHSQSADHKSTKLLIGGIVALLLGAVLVAVVFLSSSRSATDAEYSYETVVVGADQNAVLEIEAREGRYDWSITSNYNFDGYLMDGDHLAAHLAGGGFPNLDKVEDARSWTPFLQTGGGMKGLVIVSNGDEELTARVRTEFRRNPPFFLLCLFPLGLLVALGGLIVTIMGLARKTRRPSRKI